MKLRGKELERALIEDDESDDNRWVSFIPKEIEKIVRKKPKRAYNDKERK